MLMWFLGDISCMVTVCKTIFQNGLCGFHFSQPLTLALSTAIFVNTGALHTESHSVYYICAMAQPWKCNCLTFAFTSKYPLSDKQQRKQQKKEKSTFTTVTELIHSNRSIFSLLCFYLDHFCKIFPFRFTNKLSGYLHFPMAEVQSLCETLSQDKVLSEEDTYVPHIWIIIHPLCLCASMFRLRSSSYLKALPYDS